MPHQDVAQLFRGAVGHHQAGRLDVAERGYRAALAEDPLHVASLHHLGIIALQTGRARDAIELIGRAAGLKPELPDQQYNLGVALQGVGRLDEAAACYRNAISLKSNYAAAYMNLGNLLLQQGRLSEAIASYRQLLALEPRSAVAHYNIANVLVRQERWAEAEASYRMAIDCKPDFAEAYNNLGNALKDQGRLADAAQAYGRALALKPDYAEVHNNLGIVASLHSAHGEALKHFRAAVELAPQFVEARNNLGLALSRQGATEAAIREFEATLALRPGDLDATQHLARELLAVGAAGEAAALLKRALPAGTAETRSLLVLCLQSLSAEALEPLGTEVLRALSEGWARGGELERVGISLLARRVGVAECVAKLDAGVALAAADLAKLAADPLTRQVLICGRACDRDLERVLTAARRRLLATAQAEATAETSAEPLDFVCALAQQCFINEYVFAQTPDERAEVERLAAAITERIRAGADIPAHWLAASAAYAPLWKIKGAERLVERGWPSPVDDLLTQQVSEPAEERAIRPSLPAFTPLDESSLVVQAQYEENPYPRWVTPPPLIKPLSVNDFVRGKFPRAPFRPLATPDGPDVLIAGCGSGSHAIEAHRRYAGARVLAVDLSRTALAYAVRKTRALDLAIEYGQADILELGSLDRRFDVIEAAGSLQCLVDPAAGWRVLLSLLKPGGVMLLGLYSEIARADINAARAFIAERGRGGSAEEIRRCREEIAAFPPETPGRTVLNSGDFYATSDCRDLLFHVQEYQHTIPEIGAFIAAENLTFLGFHLDARTLRAYAARFPDDVTMTDLAHWDAFERGHPHIFAAMYQFGVQKA
jgi:tetratricopeptide (TPR) repeat protein/SAM-dependent methyltransferase